MITSSTISDENMTSDAWDKFKEREKRKKEGGREKKYLIIMAVFIAFCSLGSIATFSKSTKDINENEDIQKEDMNQRYYSIQIKEYLNSSSPVNKILCSHFRVISNLDVLSN